MSEWLFACAAKDIQRYILDGDKLKDMVGGSALVDSLCTTFLNDAIDKLGIKKEEHRPLVQAAGWARIIIPDTDKAHRLAAVWPMLVSRYAPGLQMVQALVEINNGLPKAIACAEQVLRAERNVQEVPLPQATPLMERCPRTGNAALRRDKELLDRGLSRKRDFSGSGGDSIESRLAKKAKMPSGIIWPTDMDELASGNYVAVIHADGNGLGSFVQQLTGQAGNAPERAEQHYSDFSDAIKEAGIDACAAGFREAIVPAIEKNVIPARIIVLGGDDLTIIVRADLAFLFTTIYLRAFEQSAQKEFESRHLPVGTRLTACAGIAFVKSAYPFSRAYELSSSLCSFTKKIAKQKENLSPEDKSVPASFAFHRVAKSISGTYSEILSNELTTAGGRQLAFGPYAIGTSTGTLPGFDELSALSEAVRAMPSGTMRELLTDLYHSHEMADAKLLRAIRIAESAPDKPGGRFQAALQQLTGKASLFHENKSTPLLDAHVLNRVLAGGVDAL